MQHLWSAVSWEKYTVKAKRYQYYYTSKKIKVIFLQRIGEGVPTISQNVGIIVHVRLGLYHLYYLANAAKSGSTVCTHPTYLSTQGLGDSRQTLVSGPHRPPT